MQIDFFHDKVHDKVHGKTKTKAQKVEEALIEAGDRGISNAALNHISFRYGAVIFRLRKDGHIIETGPTSRTGLVIYKWKGKA